MTFKISIDIYYDIYRHVAIHLGHQSSWIDPRLSHRKNSFTSKDGCRAIPICDRCNSNFHNFYTGEFWVGVFSFICDVWRLEFGMESLSNSISKATQTKKQKAKLFTMRSWIFLKKWTTPEYTKCIRIIGLYIVLKQ